MTNRTVEPISDGLNWPLESTTIPSPTHAADVKPKFAAWKRLVRAKARCARPLKRSAGDIIQNVVSTSQAAVFGIRPREKAAKDVVIDIHGVRLMAESLADSVCQIAVIMEKLLQEVRSINQNLSGIKEELRKQNILISSGGSGPEGFAGIVYRYIKMHAGRSKRRSDRFFVWHPDTSWHSAFYDMVTKDPLPASFCGESDDLDRLCIGIKAFRQLMRAENRGDEDLVCHILIPSWYDIKLDSPLHFPDELLPMRIIGPTHDGGKALVSFNLPHAQGGLSLEGVDNIFDPKLLSRDNAEAVGTGIAISGFISSGFAGSGLGVGAAGLMGIAASPFSILVVAPLFFGSAYFGATAGEEAGQVVADMLSNKPARILGSYETIQVDA